MITLQKDFGRYTITVTEGFQYTNIEAGLYEHTFEFARTGYYERYLISIVDKRKTLDVYRFWENYYDCIDYKDTKTIGMTLKDWERVIEQLDKELKSTRRKLKANQ